MQTNHHAAKALRRPLNPVEIVLVTLAEPALPEEPALPAAYRAGDVWQETQSVVGRHNRQPEHVAEGHQKKQPFHRGANLQRLLRALVPEEAIQELPQGPHGATGPDGAVVIALLTVAVVVMGWFAVGSIWNVRKGSATLRWFREGLPLIGEKTTLRWLGTTSVELVLAKAKPPFENVTLVIFLEPRDVPWLWALSRRRGRRDALIVRGKTRRPPHHDIEALEPGSWPAHEARRRMAAEPWPEREAAARGELTVFTKEDEALPVADALLELARDAQIKVRHLSVRKADPNFLLHADLPGPPMPAPRFFEALRAIGERAMHS